MVVNGVCVVGVGWVLMGDGVGVGVLGVGCSGGGDFEVGWWDRWLGFVVGGGVGGCVGVVVGVGGEVGVGEG